MLALVEAPFQTVLERTAKAAGKLAKDYARPPALARNTRGHLGATLRPFRDSGLLPDYPLGCDFTEVEQRLVRALVWLKAATGRPTGKLATIIRALATRPRGEPEAVRRMGLERPSGWRAALEARLLTLALARTRSAAPPRAPPPG
jgi:hypothetical protein